MAIPIYSCRADQMPNPLVNCEPDAFLRVVERNRGGLVAMTGGSGLLQGGYQYMTAYKGLTFFTETNEPLSLPSGIELFTADSISIV